jgi:hypothetical protein
MNANDKLLEVFATIQKEARAERWVSNLTNYVGHIVINGKTYEVTISLESDVDEMDVDPMGEEVTKLEAT